MRAFEYQMLWCGDQAFLGAGIAAPKQEYNGFFACVELFDYMVGKGCPADILVTVGLSASYG